MTYAKIEEIILSILETFKKHSDAVISPEHTIREVLEVDSINLLIIILKIESEFGITFEREMLHKAISTDIKTIAKYIEQELQDTQAK